MRAAVTQSKRRMEVIEVPEPGRPGAGQVLVRPEAVGLCGSDFHHFTGDLGTVDDLSVLYPRIQGHEASAVIEEVGPDCPPHLQTGARVAIWPVAGCGKCYPCGLGRVNVCANLSLVGVHRDGALQERLLVPAAQVFPVGDQEAALTAFVEPVSIAMRTVERGRVAAGEQVVVLGAGPIGQALALAVTDRDASVLLVDRIESRLDRGKAAGADLLLLREGDDAVAAAREWAGGDGAPVVLEATGAPALVQTALEIVAPAGRVVVVGLSDHAAPVRVGDLPFKEIDLLGTSCADEADFAAAVDLVARRSDAVAPLISHDFPLERAPEAIEYAIEHPVEVMKAVVLVE
jgi:L-gulonate 5-dehydrogenase